MTFNKLRVDIKLESNIGKLIDCFTDFRPAKCMTASMFDEGSKKQNIILHIFNKEI